MKKLRYLFGFADTEGAPHKKFSKSNLWDLSIVFRYVIDGQYRTIDPNIYHVCQFSMNQHAEKNSVQRPLKSFRSSVDHIKKHHQCDRVLLAFWNDSHDRAVLKKSGFGDVWTVDMMKWHGKAKLGGPHFALGDVQVMMEFSATPFDIMARAGPPIYLEAAVPQLDEAQTVRRIGGASTEKRKGKETMYSRSASTDDDSDIDAITESLVTLAIRAGLDKPCRTPGRTHGRSGKGTTDF